MLSTGMKQSNIFFLKSKFFLCRFMIYFSFLLIPVWIQKTIEVAPILQLVMMIFYTLFMMGQWFFLGKEIDYKLKIYFRANSSIDRIIYRTFLGLCFFIIYFNLLSFLPSKWTYNCFWATWILLGIFYSWPTRGKIIEESMASNLSEFRYLDSFEKTLVALILVTLAFSIPESPKLTEEEALKLFFDSGGNLSSQIWNFLKVSYYPFYRYPQFLKLAWGIHFYLAGAGLFLLNLYALLRFFVSRRLSLLGLFALISSWSFSKILVLEYGVALSTTYSLLWTWSTLWVIKSSAYRSGLFLGLVNYLGVIINPVHSFLILPHLVITYIYFLKGKTLWFQRQFLKYTAFGVGLILITLLTHLEYFENMISLPLLGYCRESLSIINRKAFNILAIFGILIVTAKYLFSNMKAMTEFQLDKEKLSIVLVSLFLLFIYAIFFEYEMIRAFHVMWIVVFLALLPLELIFQKISRLRSNRNMIYLIYILICLLDGHFEGRIKIFLRFFEIE